MLRTDWSYVCGPGEPPLLGLTVGQAVDRYLLESSQRVLNGLQRTMLFLAVV
jgi:hypothetical protein